MAYGLRLNRVPKMTKTYTWDMPTTEFHYSTVCDWYSDLDQCEMIKLGQNLANYAIIDLIWLSTYNRRITKEKAKEKTSQTTHI